MMWSQFQASLYGRGAWRIKKSQADVKIMEGCLLSIQKAPETMPESSVK
jgi:hypothetical protein